MVGPIRQIADAQIRHALVGLKLCTSFIFNAVKHPELRAT
jgi:hypothetical protein